MNDLVKFNTGGVPANLEDLETGLANVQQNIQGSSGGVQLLRLLKSGVFAMGQENIEPEEDSLWAVNPYSVMHGFACWGDGVLHDERMVPFSQQPPNRAELPDYGNPWQPQIAMVLACLNGEDEGLNVLYKGTSLGLQNAAKELITAIIAQLKNDKVNIVPVVTLEADSYQHKKHGQIFYPVLEIQNWISMDGTGADLPDDESEAEPEGEAAEPASEPATQTRRRRRRAAAQSDDAPEPQQSSNRRRRARAS